MANVKNFGLVGVGSTVQYGKAGPSLAANSATVLQATGSAAFMIPLGNDAARPTPATGMIRTNNQSTPVLEYYNGTTWTTLATGGTAVTSVTGTADRITSTGGTTPVLDIASTYVGQTSITTLGTVGTGTWQGSTVGVAYGGTGAATFTAGYLKADGTTAFTTSATIPTSDLSGDIDLTTQVTGVLPAANGGTGVANSNTITLGGNISTAGALTTSGAFASTFTMTGTTTVTFPETGTLLSTATIADNAVTSFSAGTTGFTPNSATDGAVVLDGTLAATHGGTGLATFSAGDVLYASGANTWAAAAPGATSGVQGYDAGLAALASKTSTGIMVQTGADAYTSRTLVAPAAGITITDADGIAGNPTFALANDLAALEGLATTGYIVRTGDGTATTRAIEGTVDRIVVTNGSGVSSDTNVDLATVSQAASGDFVKVTLDGYGRVTGNTAVVTADITALVDSTYVNVAGDSMTSAANLTFSGGGEVLGLPATPTTTGSATSKAYVDSLVAGLSWKQAAHVMSTTDVTISAPGATIDGETMSVNERVLLVGQTDPYEDGIYVYNGAAVPMTRSTDADAFGDLNGAAIFVQSGTNADTGWTQTATLTSLTTGATQNWVQFSGANAYIAGAGLLLTGNSFSVNFGAGIAQLPSDEVGIDVVAGKAVQLTGTAAGDQLTFVLDGGAASGLEQSASGLKISAAGVTNAMLANNSLTINGDSGTFSSALGSTLIISGDSVQGVSSTATAGTVDFTIANASSSQKGVATFATTEFVVTAGDVALGLVGVTKGGTGFSSYAVGDLLYADTTTSLAKLADIATGNVLLSGGVGVAPSYGKVGLTTHVTGILPAANGGTGVANSNTITLGGDIATDGALTMLGAFPATFNISASTNVTFPTSGTLATVGSTVASFSAGTTGLTPASATTGAVVLGGTLIVANGGTGATSFTAGRVLLGDGTNPIAEDADLAFTAASNTLTIGSATLAGTAAGDVTLTATATNADINLVPNGTGAVVIGPAGAGVIASDTGNTLTVDGDSGLILTAGSSGEITMTLTGTTANKVTVSGPTPAEYATSLADADLVNKYYVDTVAGSAAGDVKAFKQVVNLGADGTTNIGTVLPTGATILSVKVNVTVVNTTSTLSVGIAGGVSDYMTAAENDPQTTGLYLAECMVVNSAVQIIATVAGQTGAVGSATVVVTYQIAN